MRLRRTPAGLGASVALPARRARKVAVSPVALLPELTQSLQNLWGAPLLDGFGLPDVVGAAGNLPALGVETVADLAVSVVALFGAGALINDSGDPETDSSGGDDGSGAGGVSAAAAATTTTESGTSRIRIPDASNFFIRGGATGIWWILLCAALSAYCILIGKAPHLGAMWGVIALGVGWGMFVAVAVGLVGLLGLFFLVDTVLLHTRSDVHAQKQMVQKQISENLVGAEIDSTARPADKKAVSANANLKLPEGVQVMGTDAQLVQVELKAGEELSAEPGAMAYMSPNVRSITSLQGGLVAGLTRLLAGEPFFLNNFKNVAKDGGMVTSRWRGVARAIRSSCWTWRRWVESSSARVIPTCAPRETWTLALPRRSCADRWVCVCSCPTRTRSSCRSCQATASRASAATARLSGKISARIRRWWWTRARWLVSPTPSAISSG